MSALLLMPSKERNEAFASVMERVLEGLSQREVRRRTGISATYVGDMLWGIVPSYQILVRMAEGLEWGPDTVREVFRAGGYAAPALAISEPDDTYDAVYGREMRAARERLAAEGIFELPQELGHQGGTRKLTAEDAKREAQDFYEFVRELHGKRNP